MSDSSPAVPRLRPLSFAALLLAILALGVGVLTVASNTSEAVAEISPAGDGLSEPDVSPTRGCNYSVTNNSGGTIWFVENYSNGIIWPGVTLENGQSADYVTKYEKFEPILGHGLAVYRGGVWGDFDKILVGPCGSAFNYPGGIAPNPQPDPGPAPDPGPDPDPGPAPDPGPGPVPDCSYELTNNTSSSVWFIENYGRGVVFPSIELPAGSSTTYDITEAEFEPGESWLELSTEPWPAGDILEQYKGPCGTEFVYGGGGPQPDPGPGPAPDPNACFYTITNGSDRLTQVWAFVSGGIEYLDEIPAGATVQSVMPDGFNPGEPSFNIVGLYFLNADGSRQPTGFSSSDPCGSSLGFQADPAPQPDPGPGPGPQPDPGPGPAPDPNACFYTITNGSDRLTQVWAFVSGGIEYLDEIPAGATVQSVMPDGFNPGEPSFNIVGLYFLNADGSRQPTGFSSSDPCGSSLGFQTDPAPQPDPGPAPQPDPGPAPQPNPQPGVTSVGGSVTNQSGAPVSGVLADLFASNQSGERLGYLSSARTASDGGYSFGVNAGCYAVTLSAPQGSRFANGSRWANVSGCVQSGQSLSSLDATIANAGNTATLGDSVSYSDGSPVAGVLIDLFSAAADGSRGEYMRYAESDAAGNYRFTVAPGCYVVTFVAPTGEQFTNGAGWLNSTVCVQAGEANTSVDAVIAGAGGQATVSGAVTRSGGGAGDVAIDVFATAADGSRGDWVAQTRTDGSGGYSASVPAGCYTLTFIAPSGQSFTNGSSWFNLSLCVQAGGSSSGNNAELQ